MSTLPISADPDSQATVRSAGARPTDAATSRATAVTDATAGDAAVTVDTIPVSPPPEVLVAVAAAAGAQDRLAAAGQALHFSLDQRGRLSVQLTDLKGTVLSTVPASTVLAVAAGGSPD